MDATDTRTILVGGDLTPVGKPGDLLVQGDLDSVFDGLWDAARSADCFLANLECPLTVSDARQSKAGPHLRADPRVARALSGIGPLVLSLANNHIFDYGLNGVNDTIAALETSGIRWYGVGKNVAEAATPLWIDLAGFRLGLLSYAEHEFNWQSDDQWCTSMLEPATNVLQIQEAARQCDSLIVLLHGGPENWHYPSPRIVKTCRAFAAAGAAAVLVSHAHAVMGSELHHGTPIVYGLGNLLFHATPRPFSWRLGLVVRLRIARHTCVQMDPLPVLADSHTGCLRLMREPELTLFHSFYREISEVLRDDREVQERWRLFCASQVPHLAREITRGIVAMCPGSVIRALLPRHEPRERSYYRKGARLLRGLTTCENHRDMLGQISDLLAKNRLREYSQKARGLQQTAEAALAR